MAIPRSFLVLLEAARIGCVLALFGFVSFAQRVATIIPEKNGHSERLSNSLTEQFRQRSVSRIKFLDPDLSEAAFRSLNIKTPFNMSLSDAKRATSVMGCDFVVLLRGASQRRTSLAKGDYFESYAVIYLVSGRSGRLVDWRLSSFEADSIKKADEMLFESVPEIYERIAAGVSYAEAGEIREEPPPAIGTVPDEGSPASKALRPPVPYKRIKPKYTETAFLYDARATVDIEADIGADGNVLRTEIVRWAGFGLDESVTEAVRKMNWKPAERRGKPLPMRVLLRYNFTKVEDD